MRDAWALAAELQWARWEMAGGPQPMARKERLTLARTIADRARALRGDDVLAVGLYGSLARGTDGPYSDIEILCVLRTTGEGYTREWVAGPWKAEVDFYGQDVLLEKAAGVDERWPLTHGAYVHVRALHDPDRFFPKLRGVVLNQPKEKFLAAMRELIVGDLYELVGKLRNARHFGHTAGLPMLVVHMALYGAFLVGLDNRHCYTSGTRAFEESLRLPGRPGGYDALCRLVMGGKLNNPEHVVGACEAFWSGVERWALTRGLTIEEPRWLPF